MENRREVPRYMCELPARLSQPDGAAICELTVLRIGVKGCGTGATGSGLPAVSQKGNITLEWQGSQFQADVEVVWKRMDGKAGFRFTFVDERDRELLLRICAHHALQPLTPLPKTTVDKDKPA